MYPTPTSRRQPASSSAASARTRLSPSPPTAASTVETPETSLFSDFGDDASDAGGKSWQGLDASLGGVLGISGPPRFSTTGGGWNSFVEDLVVVDEGRDLYDDEGDDDEGTEGGESRGPLDCLPTPRRPTGSQHDGILIDLASSSPETSPPRTLPLLPSSTVTRTSFPSAPSSYGKTHHRAASGDEGMHGIHRAPPTPSVNAVGRLQDAVRRARGDVPSGRDSLPSSSRAHESLSSSQQALPSSSKASAVRDWLTDTQGPPPSPPPALNSSLPPDATSTHHPRRLVPINPHPNELRSARGFPPPSSSPRRRAPTPPPESSLHAAYISQRLETEEEEENESPPTPPPRLSATFSRPRQPLAVTVPVRSPSPEMHPPSTRLHAFLALHPVPSITGPTSKVAEPVEHSASDEHAADSAASSMLISSTRSSLRSSKGKERDLTAAESGYNARSPRSSQSYSPAYPRRRFAGSPGSSDPPRNLRQSNERAPSPSHPSPPPSRSSTPPVSSQLSTSLGLSPSSRVRFSSFPSTSRASTPPDFTSPSRLPPRPSTSSPADDHSSTDGSSSSSLDEEEQNLSTSTSRSNSRAHAEAARRRRRMFASPVKDEGSAETLLAAQRAVMGTPHPPGAWSRKRPAVIHVEDQLVEEEEEEEGEQERPARASPSRAPSERIPTYKVEQERSDRAAQVEIEEELVWTVRTARSPLKAASPPAPVAALSPQDPLSAIRPANFPSALDSSASLRRPSTARSLFSATSTSPTPPARVSPSAARHFLRPSSPSPSIISAASSHSRLRLSHLRAQLAQAEEAESVARQDLATARSKWDEVRWVKAKFASSGEAGRERSWKELLGWAVWVVGMIWVSLCILQSVESSLDSSPYYPALYAPSHSSSPPGSATSRSSSLLFTTTTFDLPPGMSAFEVPGRLRSEWKALWMDRGFAL